MKLKPCLANMEKNFVHIAISPSALAASIESGTIHAADFKCLNSASKKIVWGLFLSSMKSTLKNKFEYRDKHYV
jgi:hypothetical protein